MVDIKYVALGDSFTEGIGDEDPDGVPRGWADLVAQGIAQATGSSVSYANLAVRGKLLRAIIDEQLQPAFDLAPTLMTLNGGGNDILRPGADLDALIARIAWVVDQARDAGVELVLLSGANPTRGLPMRRTIQAKGDALNVAVRQLAADQGLKFADNWSDSELMKAGYWSEDRLHLNAAGHRRVASRILQTMDFLSFSDPQESLADAERRPGPLQNAQYYQRHVFPWVKRRITGRSSGDGRSAKYDQWQRIDPRGRV